MIWVESQDTQTDMKNMEWARGDSLWKLRWPVFLVSQMVKTLPAMHKTQVRSLGWEDPLEKRMATHSSIPEIYFSLPLYNHKGFDLGHA